MATLSRSLTIKSRNNAPKNKTISQLIDDIDLSDEKLYKFSDDELDTMIEELQTSSSARSPEEIDKMNATKYSSALKSMQFASLASEKAVLSVDDVKESDKIEEATPEMVNLAIKSSVVFAFVHGNVTTKKSWIRISHSDKDKSKFVSFPLLNTVGSRSVLVHVYREEISNFLQKGKKNTLVSILEKSNVKLDPLRRKFLFPKGHLLAKDKKEIDLIRSDLNHIFAEMAKPVEKRKFELKFFSI